MATDKNVTSQNFGGKSGAQGMGMNVGSPVSNEAYNVITALQAKLEGLEAYRKYTRDGDMGVWQKLMPMEMQSVQMLVDELERMVKDGKFRGGQTQPHGNQGGLSTGGGDQH